VICDRRRDDTGLGFELEDGNPEIAESLASLRQKGGTLNSTSSLSSPSVPIPRQPTPPCPLPCIQRSLGRPRTMASRSLHRYRRRREAVPTQNPPLAEAKRPFERRANRALSSFHRSGFSVDDSPTVWPQDADGLERLARYLLRCPLSLSRVHWTERARTIFYQGKSSHDDPFATDPQGETLDVFEFLARVLTQIPEPRRHGMHYFGAYSSRARARRKAQGLKLVATPTDRDKPASSDEPKPSSSERAALRRRWANLIKRVFKTDPLLCECGEKFRIISFITEPKVIRKILDHLQKRQPSSRAPPRNDSPLRSQPS